MPNVIAADILGVQDMTRPLIDLRFYKAGVEQISELVFGLYRNTDAAREWLDCTPLSYGLLRETQPLNPVEIYIQHLGNVVTKDEIWTVTFHEAAEAVAFKLMWT